MKIKYVGVKEDGETAFSRETGITWFPGTCEDVPATMAVKMLKHPDVFAEDVAEVAAPVTLQPLVKPPVISLPAGVVITLATGLAPGGVIGEVPTATHTPELDAMTREELHALAKDRSIKVHHSSGAAAVKAALLAVVDAPAAG